MWYHFDSNPPCQRTCVLLGAMYKHHTSEMRLKQPRYQTTCCKFFTSTRYPHGFLQIQLPVGTRKSHNPPLTAQHRGSSQPGPHIRKRQDSSNVAIPAFGCHKMLTSAAHSSNFHRAPKHVNVICMSIFAIVVESLHSLIRHGAKSDMWIWGVVEANANMG